MFCEHDCELSFAIHCKFVGQIWTAQWLELQLMHGDHPDAHVAEDVSVLASLGDNAAQVLVHGALMMTMRGIKERVDDAPLPGLLKNKPSVARGVSHGAFANGRAFDLDAPPVIQHQVNAAVVVADKGGARA
tara:strand:+ start:5667 stop:6062 length:396 start_codon:yes stop_codon:yes gene_type:complete